MFGVCVVYMYNVIHVDLQEYRIVELLPRKLYTYN